MNEVVNEVETVSLAESPSAAEPRSLVRSEAGWTGVELGELFAKGHFVSARHADVVRLSVCLACWEAISQDVAKTPLELRRRTPNGSVVVQPGEHQVADLLWSRPSAYYGWGEFIRIAAAYLAATRGYAFAGRWTVGGKLLEVQGVPPGQIMPYTNVQAGRYFYDVLPQTDHDHIQWSWMVNRRLSADEIVPVRLRSLNGFDPMSNADLARESMDLINSMRLFQADSFASGGVGVYAVAFPQALTDAQFDRLKRDFAEAAKEAKRTGKPLIFEGDGKTVPEIKRISMSAVDADFVKSQSAAMHDVLRYYRMPPTKVGIFENVKYDNVDPINRAYVDDTLCPIFQVIQDGLDQLLLSDDEDKDLFFQFDRDAAFAEDPKAREERVLAQWKSGIIEYDEARQKLGLNTYGGEAGQVRQMSGNFVLIDRKNEVVLKAGGNAPGAEGDQAPQDEAGAEAGDGEA